jgi:hypothetical protein
MGTTSAASGNESAAIIRLATERDVEQLHTVFCEVLHADFSRYIF